MLPENAPKEFLDRQILWNSVEKAEKRRDARLARDVLVVLPNELIADGQIRLAHVLAPFFGFGQ